MPYARLYQHAPNTQQTHNVGAIVGGDCRLYHASPFCLYIELSVFALTLTALWIACTACAGRQRYQTAQVDP